MPVVDRRLRQLVEKYGSSKINAAELEFVDIAGKIFKIRIIVCNLCFCEVWFLVLLMEREWEINF